MPIRNAGSDLELILNILISVFIVENAEKQNGTSNIFTTQEIGQEHITFLTAKKAGQETMTKWTAKITIMEYPPKTEEWELKTENLEKALEIISENSKYIIEIHITKC